MKGRSVTAITYEQFMLIFPPMRRPIRGERGVSLICSYDDCGCVVAVMKKALSVGVENV